MDQLSEEVVCSVCNEKVLVKIGMLNEDQKRGFVCKKCLSPSSVQKDRDGKLLLE
jgi:transposase-like protein